jgi:hypothetical protein
MLIQTTLPDLSQTSISIIINPAIGIQILKSLYPQSSKTRTRSKSGPRGVWFQPGAESSEIRQYVSEMGLGDRVICSGHGECILEDGEEVLKMRKGEGSRL